MDGTAFQKRGHGVELLNIRPYIPGEDARRVDWKSTARVGRMMSRDFIEDEEHEIDLALDMGPTSAKAPRYDLEWRISAAATIAVDFHRKSLSYGLFMPNGQVPRDRGPLQLRRILTAFAGITESDTPISSEWLEQGCGFRSPVVLFSRRGLEIHGRFGVLPIAVPTDDAIPPQPQAPLWSGLS